VPIISQNEVQEIETAHKSVVSPYFLPHVFSPIAHESRPTLRGVKSRPRDNQEWSKVGVTFPSNANRLAERATAKQRKIFISRLTSLAPIIFHIVRRVKWIIGGRIKRNISRETMLSIRFSFDEIPKRDQAWCFDYRLSIRLVSN